MGAHNWPKDENEHLWTRWFADQEQHMKAGKLVKATQYRTCVDPNCDAVDYRETPLG